MTERRRSPRFHISQLVEVAYGREYFLQAAGIDISENGLLCETAEAPEKGSHVFLLLEVRGEYPGCHDGQPESIQIEGYVARTESAEEGYYVGIDFSEIPDEPTRNALHCIIDNLQS